MLDFPGLDLPMLDFLGIVAVTAIITVMINLLVGSLAIERVPRVILLVAIGLWIGTVVALAAAGQFDDAGRRPVPLVGVALVSLLLAVLLAAVMSAKARAALLALPMPLLIGVHSARLLGVFFLALAAAGRLDGPFPYFAGWGDILAGGLAIPVAVLAARSPQRSVGWIAAWNLFGMLDLLDAVSLGVMSTVGSPLQRIDTEIGSAAMPHLPWVLIPTVIVPTFLVIHIVMFAKLRALWATRPLLRYAD